jgi:Transglycosylase-like domain
VPAGREANVAAVQKAAAAYGWGAGGEWAALQAVINRESGFNNVAQNPTSTAFGLFQFLDSTWASVGGVKTSDANIQAQLGLRYIHDRYGDPFGAQAHENAYGWYDTGGWLPPGATTVLNGTGRPELVLNPPQVDNLNRILERTPDARALVNGGIHVQMASADPHEVVDEVMYRLKVAGRGGVYSTVMGG